MVVNSCFRPIDRLHSIKANVWKKMICQLQNSTLEKLHTWYVDLHWMQEPCCQLSSRLNVCGNIIKTFHLRKNVARNNEAFGFLVAILVCHIIVHLLLCQWIFRPNNEKKINVKWNGWVHSSMSVTNVETCFTLSCHIYISSRVCSNMCKPLISAPPNIVTLVRYQQRYLMFLL